MIKSLYNLIKSKPNLKTTWKSPASHSQSLSVSLSLSIARSHYSRSHSLITSAHCHRCYCGLNDLHSCVRWCTSEHPQSWCHWSEHHIDVKLNASHSLRFFFSPCGILAGNSYNIGLSSTSSSPPTTTSRIHWTTSCQHKLCRCLTISIPMVYAKTTGKL